MKDLTSILVVSKNSLWLESFFLLANSFSNSLVFSLSGHAYQAIFLDAEGLESRALDRLVLKYNHLPIFLSNAHKNIKKKYRGKVVLVPSKMDVVKTVQLIELYFSQRNLKEKISVLNVKEELVFNLICDGLTNKEISRCSELSLASVKYYLSSIYSKLKVKNRSDLALLNREFIV